MTESLKELVRALRALPSVGEKSAWRMALHLMDQPDLVSFQLADALKKAKRTIRPCSRCFTWCEADLCPVCASDKRDRALICVVEKPRDMWAIEESGRYRGVYHVLGGVLSPMNGITAETLRIRELLARLEDSSIKEVIVGLGGSSEAETTAHYLSRLLERFPSLAVSRFARGLAAGMEIEYADRYTLDQALNERKIIRYGDE